MQIPSHFVRSGELVGLTGDRIWWLLDRPAQDASEENWTAGKQIALLEQRKIAIIVSESAFRTISPFRPGFLRAPHSQLAQFISSGGGLETPGIHVPWREEMLGQAGSPGWRQFLLSSPYRAGDQESYLTEWAPFQLPTLQVQWKSKSAVPLPACILI